MMINLRRLSCPAVPFLYILDRYADIRGWDINDTLLRGTFFRLLFGRRQQFKKRFRERKSAAAGKNRAENLDSANILLHLSLLIPTRDETLRFCILLFLLFLL